MPSPSFVRRTLALALAAVVLVLGGFGWHRLVLAPEADAADVGLRPVDLPAPDVAIPTADGSTFVVSEHRGEVLVLHFWATWCPPCREELPSIQRLAAELSAALPGRVRVVAISVDDGWAPVREFLGGRLPAGLTVALAPGQEASGPFFCAARGRCPAEFALPETHLVDPSGRLVGYLEGPRDWSAPALRRVLGRLAE